MSNTAASIRYTFHLRISGFLAWSNIDHKKAFGRLSEAHGKFFKVIPCGAESSSVQRVYQSSSMIEHVHPEVDIIKLGKLSLYSVRKTFGGIMTTRFASFDERRSKYGTITVD